jgi:hypothetical protein
MLGCRAFAMDSGATCRFARKRETPTYDERAVQKEGVFGCFGDSMEDPRTWIRLAEELGNPRIPHVECGARFAERTAAFLRTLRPLVF